MEKAVADNRQDESYASIATIPQEPEKNLPAKGAKIVHKEGPSDKGVILEVLTRAADGHKFIARLAENPGKVLQGYDPIPEERAYNLDKSLHVGKYIQPWTCRDGRCVVLRPIEPEDRLLEKELIERLSAESSRFRFFDRIREATPEMLNQFCNIDYVHEIAVIAEYKAGDEKRNVGVGRLIIEPNKESGEFAIVVADDFQNNGLGTKLLHTLIDIGREKELKNIYGIVLKDNWKMLGLAKKLGFTIEASPYEEVKVIREF